MFFCQDVTDHCTTGSDDSPLFDCRDHFAPPLLAGKNGMGSAGFCWSYADNFGHRLAAQTALTFSLHVLLQVYRRQASMFTTYSLPPEVQMFSAVRCLRPPRVAVKTSKRISRIRSVARSLRAVALAVGQGSSSTVTSLSWRSAILELSQFLTQASSSRRRRIWFLESRGKLRMEQRAFGGTFRLPRSGWCLRWLDVSICTDASEKGFAFAVREGCRELASEVGRVSERTSIKRSLRSIRVMSRALRSIVPESGV